MRNSGAGQVAVSEDNGRAGRNRTRNRRFWRPVLYQLSYCPNLNSPLIKSLLQARHGIPSRKYVTTHPPNHGELFPVWNTCHCGRRQGAQPVPILRFGAGAQRSISPAGASRSPDGLSQPDAQSAAIPETQRVSRCRVCLRQNLQYFLNSTRSGCKRRFLFVV